MRYSKSSILKVYSGKKGCACGCRGTYSNSKSQISKVWGKYLEITDNEKDITNINYYSGFVKDDEEYDSFIYFDSDDGLKTYTIFFKKGA